MRSILAAALCALLCVVAPAAAHRSATSRVHNIRHIVQAAFGDVCDVGTMNVPIVRRDLGEVVTPDGVRRDVRAQAHWEGDTPPYHDCRVDVDDRHWTTVALCTELGHELGGHLSGIRFDAADAYRWPDGTLDPLHSRDPRSLMWPFTLAPWPPCEHGAADAKPPARRALTRTTALVAGPAPCHARAHASGSPIVIGDSVTVAAAGELARRGLGVNARGCRQISEGLHILRVLHPRAAVLALGANGTVNVRQLRAARRLTGRLALVTPGGRDDGDRHRILRFARAHHVPVLDWARRAAHHRAWLAPDGLHLTAAGARAFAAAIATTTRSIR